MGYPLELLSEGETVEFEMRPHWRSLLMPITTIVLVLIAVGIITAMWGSWFEGSVGRIGRWVFLGVGLIVVAMFAIKPLAYWFTTQYVFTNRRIIIRRGLVAREGRDMPLSKMNNVSFSVSVVGRLLNYGRLTVDSASDEELVIDDVPNVEFIQREVNRLHEEDDFRRRRDLAEER
jgi:uncharacterized membrane protein YdbT with pleckstrin-like domain